MTISFEETDSKQTALWDYGWFDVTRFGLTPSCGIDPSDADVIRHLIAAPIYQRSFCESPDPWGASMERHGRIRAISPDWFQRISADQSMKRICDAINDGGFDNPPSGDKISHVTNWVDNVRTRGDAGFVLNAPDDERVRVEWAHIWFVFAEFMCVNRRHRELAVAVIGDD